MLKEKKGSFDQDFKGYSKITLSYNECKRLKNFLSVFGCLLKLDTLFWNIYTHIYIFAQ